MTCSELSSLILQNYNSIAFLVGNGIHNYETYNKGIQGKVCWNELRYFLVTHEQVEHTDGQATHHGWQECYRFMGFESFYVVRSNRLKIEVIERIDS